MGTATHAGLATYYDMLRDGHEQSEAVEMAQVDGNLALQGLYVAQERYTLAGLSKVLVRAIKTTVEQGIQVPPHKVIAVEEKFAHGILDLLTRVGGELVVTDHKTIYDADEHKALLRLNEYEASHQLYHQAWVTRQHFGETPKYVQIQQIVLTPTCRVKVEMFSITDEQIDRWLQSSEVHWSRMANEEEEGFAPMNFASCFNKYGKCDMFNVCHKGASLEALYRQREV
jgi:hypothetical protein